jgi:protein SCO1
VSAIAHEGRAAKLRSVPLLVVLGVATLLAACGEAKPDAPVEPSAASHAAETVGQHAAETVGQHATDPTASHAHHAAAPLAADALPGTSLYHLSDPWRAHDGGAFTLPALRGNAVVMVMFYGDCTTACPVLVRTAEQIEAALAPAERARTRFVLVTFDTERDSPEKLRAYAADKGLDRDGWHWLVGTPLQTRQLAAMLGVQLREVGNGAFAHSNVVTVLDTGGAPSVRLEGLGVDVAPAVQAVGDVLGSTIARNP